MAPIEPILFLFMPFILQKSLFFLIKNCHAAEHATSQEVLYPRSITLDNVHYSVVQGPGSVKIYNLYLKVFCQ